jgi:hypothetical protein
MSQMPPEAEAAARAERLLRSADALPKAPLTAGLGVLDSPLLRPDPGAAQRKRASLEAADAQVRAKVRTLGQADAQTLRDAVAAGRSLLDAWRDGAVEGVAAFRSKLVSDQGSVLPALIGNLLWAATAIEVVPAKVFLSFAGATLGTIGSISPNYDAVIGPVTDDVRTRLNDLHDDLLNRMDVLVFPVLQHQGFAKFAALDPPRQLGLLWQELFRVPSSDGRYIEPTKAFVLGNLQKADQDALERLQLYERVWRMSLRPGGVYPEGATYVFDGAVWAQHVSDPVWLWVGSSPQFQVFWRPTDDPNPNPGRRAAAVLRLAIERRWPSTP